MNLAAGAAEKMVDLLDDAALRAVPAIQER